MTTTMTTTQTREGEPRSAGPPGRAAEVDLSRAIAACARTVAAAKPARVEVLEVEDRTRRQLDDIGPALVGRLGAAGVAVEAVKPASERLTREEMYTERGYEEGSGGEEDAAPAPPRKPRATHALATQLFEESWTSDDGERYRSVIAVFILVDTAANEVTAMSVTRVRG